MKKIRLLLKSGAPVVCAFVLSSILLLSAVWLRSAGTEKILSIRSGNTSSAPANAKAESTMSVVCPPALGEIIVPYSPETLLWNPTKRVYETHSGTDYLCPDENVYCVMDGKIENVYFDALLGHTMAVLHPNGDKSIYASLSETLKKSGAFVRAGDVIAKCGTSAASEYKAGAHLHFEYIRHENSLPISFATAPEA